MPHRDASYQSTQPDADAVAALPGLVLLDFGTDGCGHCLDARNAVDVWVREQPGMAHLRIEDGRGRAPGRAFRVKLWPTLVLLRGGREVARVVRPRTAQDLQPLADAVAAP